MQSNVCKFLLPLLILGAGAWPDDARAGCIDPKTGHSLYKAPISEEIASSFAIAIGTVTKETLLVSPEDPAGYVGMAYVIRVERTLKGKLPATVLLWTPNTSSRYAMAVGERHVLFLSLDPLRDQLGQLVRRERADYNADACGNSSELPEGNSIVKQIELKIKSGVAIVVPSA
jgi:hypothetical protein